MKLSNLPYNNRPREKLITLGAEALSDAELLAIFLRTGIQGTHVITLAYQLISHFGSLHQLLDADQEDFCQIKGLGMAKYAQLQAALELSKRYLQHELEQKPIFSNPQAVKRFCQQKMGFTSHEAFAVIFLNNQHHMISFETLFTGTINAAPVFPRVIAKRALALNAAAIIALHNHPSGILTPSQSDLSITQEIVKALGLIDVSLLDHIIVSRTHTLSMVEEKLI